MGADTGMTKPGRIPCLNPRCRRTAPADKYEPGTEIVCGKCWKLLPETVRKRDRVLWRHHRKLERKRARLADPMDPVAKKMDERIGLLEKRMNLHWGQVRGYFLAPEKPEGLDAFLEEMGMNE